MCLCMQTSYIFVCVCVCGEEEKARELFERCVYAIVTISWLILTEHKSAPVLVAECIVQNVTS